MQQIKQRTSVIQVFTFYFCTYTEDSQHKLGIIQLTKGAIHIFSVNKVFSCIHECVSISQDSEAFIKCL